MFFPNSFRLRVLVGFKERYFSYLVELFSESVVYHVVRHTRSRVPFAYRENSRALKVTPLLRIARSRVPFAYRENSRALKVTPLLRIARTRVP